MTQYTAQPQHPVSMDDRIKALAVARETLVGKAGEPTGMMAAFGATSPAPGKSISAGGESITSLIRLAEYVAVGHDYLDTHQETSTFEGDLKKVVKKAVKRELDKRGYED